MSTSDSDESDDFADIFAPGLGPGLGDQYDDPPLEHNVDSEEEDEEQPVEDIVDSAEEDNSGEQYEEPPLEHHLDWDERLTNAIMREDQNTMTSVRTALEHGADLNSRDVDQNSNLRIAFQHRRPHRNDLDEFDVRHGSLLKLLHSSNAQFSSKEDETETFREYAVWTPAEDLALYVVSNHFRNVTYVSLMKVMRQTCEVDSRDTPRKLEMFIHMARTKLQHDKQNRSMSEFLSQSGSHRKTTLLHILAANPLSPFFLHNVSILVDNGASLYTRDVKGETPRDVVVRITNKIRYNTGVNNFGAEIRRHLKQAEKSQMDQERKVSLVKALEQRGETAKGSRFDGFENGVVQEIMRRVREK